MRAKTGQTEMKNLVIVFGNFANAPKDWEVTPLCNSEPRLQGIWW